MDITLNTHTNMKNTIEFIKANNLEELEIYQQLKCHTEEAILLQALTKQYVSGATSIMVVEILGDFYDVKEFLHLEKIVLVKNLLELGWIVQTSMMPIKVSELSNLELLNSAISLSPAFLKLLEVGSLDLVLPEIKEYNDHLEYLQDQFFKTFPLLTDIF
jgi:hypothetical protein